MMKLYTYLRHISILFFLFSSSLFAKEKNLLLPFTPPASTDYYTIASGDMTANIWSKTSHVGASCVCAPCVCAPCDIPANSNVYIAHVVTLTCDLVLGSNVNLVVESGGALIITGGGSVTGTGSFQIDAGGSVDISGDFSLSGTGDVTLNGDINIGGDLIVSGGASFCGSGNVSVTGSVVGVPDACFTGVLPIELLYFTGNINEGLVDLFWSTASEINNDYFNLFKSQDGINWINFMQIDGAGTTASTMTYSKTDNSPFLGTSYYKLKQTDFDGNFSFSNIIVIQNGFITEQEIIPFPNPTNGNEIGLEIVGFSQENMIITITDIVGKVHFTMPYNINSSRQIISLSFEDKLSGGTYFVTGSANDKVISKKIMIR